jgi:hypothetical protein
MVDAFCIVRASLTVPIDRIPDALMLQSTQKQGLRPLDRVASIARPAEAVLGARVWIHQQPNGWLFITRDPADTILFPRDHDRCGAPRYRWVNQVDGSQWGYLVEGANDVR